MKKLILLVTGLLIGLSSWAQNNDAQRNCALSIRYEVVAPSCLNGLDGEIVLRINGTKPYIIQWSDAGQGEHRAGLAAGIYMTTVRDSKGCVKKYEIEVPQGQGLQGELQISRQKVSNEKSRLIVQFFNGSKPFAINIKDLSQGPRASWRPYLGENLSAGLYLVEGFTKAGCSQIGKIDLRN